MKKILTILLTLLMVLTIAGCNSKKEEAVVGGFTEAKDKAITPELQEIFDKACEDYTGVGFEPVELVATQVVAGTNYKFLCNGTTVTNPPVSGTYYVTVYQDLKGNCSILDVEEIKNK